MHDHFHCVFEHEGETREIEGGFTGYPQDWEERSEEARRAWWDETLKAWGLPDDATVKRLWLAR
jgi:hypothetical protein